MPKRNAEIGNEQIAQRAYEISQSAERGTDEENWHRAEEQLRQEQQTDSPAGKEPKT